MLFRQLIDAPTSTYTYILADEDTKEAVIIDPVREQVERDKAIIEQLGLKLQWTLDTHVHADHVTGAGLLRQALGAQTIVSKEAQMNCASRPVDHGDTVVFGRHTLEVRWTPGHTDADLTFVLDDRSMAFTGDILLIRGCGRTDFQSGDPKTLYRSVHEHIFSLPETTQLYPGHDYRGHTMTTVGEEKRWNPRLGGGKTEADFVEIMSQLNLARPARIDEALPVNNECGMVSNEKPQTDPWASVERTAKGVPEVTTEWLASISTETKYRLIDVRSPDEFIGELGHIAGSQLVPLNTLGNIAQGWDPSAPVITVCRSGKRSGNAAVELETLGINRVASLRGGMMLWNDQKRPIEH